MSPKPPKKIVVLTEYGQSSKYLIHKLASCWEHAGFHVEFASRLEKGAHADIFFLHVDRTQVPDAVSQLERLHVVSVNGQVKSVRKDIFSKHLLNEQTNRTGAVIVKTKSNYGGMPETRAARKGIRFKLARRIARIALSEKIGSQWVKSFAWRHVRILDPNRYPLFPSAKAVPQGVWTNPNLMVESFLPEKDSDGKYVIRHWFFLGNREFCRTLSSSKPVTKWASMTQEERRLSRQEWWTIDVVSEADVPIEVRQVKEKLRLDFGRIDWAYHDGQPVVFDVNKTPAIVGEPSGDASLDARIQELLCEFASGLNALE